MENKFISLLYPSEESQAYHADRNNLPDISEDVCEELGVELLGKMPIDPKLAELSDAGKFERNVAEYLNDAADKIEQL